MFAYINEKSDKRIIDALKQEGFEIKLLAPFSALSDPVDAHADMLLLTIGNTVFVHKDYETLLDGFDNVIKIDEPMSNKYPRDVLLNIAIVGKNAFCNTKYASKTVLKYLKENDFAIHHVSQGYTHCSTCIVGENAIITADIGIAEASRKAGIDCLLISSGHITLPPYDYGFIGGASGLNEDKIYFCGSLKHHPDGKKIHDFCQKNGKTVVELCNSPLVDVGGIIII